jgi:nucleoside 2-deoxyribosyltransferase
MDRALKIYLAGGFRSGWQHAVHEELIGHASLLDPSQHSLECPAEYTRWDLDAIREADCVLAYMEASNPAGYSLSLEVGFAHALAKHIVLVEEHPTPERHRYFAMIREVANERFATLGEALEHIKVISSSLNSV